MFSELLENFLQHFGNFASNTSQVMSVPCSSISSGGPGRPAVHSPTKVLEDLKGLSFTWGKIASMFRVSRCTIMRRVHLYGLKPLSLFSSITDEQVDNVILDFISRHGSTTGEPYPRGYFITMGYTVKKGRIGCFSFTQSLLCPMAKLVVALRWPPLVDSLGICNSWMHQWVFKENHFLTL